jgi:hypothetical protein
MKVSGARPRYPKTTILFYLNKYFLTGTTSSYEFNELQIYGKAQLAVLTDPHNEHLIEFQYIPKFLKK